MLQRLPLRLMIVAEVIALSACSTPTIVRGGDPLSPAPSAREQYVENRCEHETARSTQGVNHCQDSASRDQYRREYSEYQREYEKAQDE
ncbi:hypothetical protein [Marinobacter sediminum]|uniref:hypothetical protein n=1 Tax=Marinobacter sediminum TaxID=256323 RepID=UPI001939C89D|nr:hypothetical protein [Marinobacter sediminum]